MAENIIEVGARRVGRFFMGTSAQIAAINRKYAVPHIKMTPMVRVALVLLRFYLLFLVGILVFKFITLLR